VPVPVLVQGVPVPAQAVADSRFSISYGNQMTSIREIIRQRFSPIQPLPPGIYHYQAPPEDKRNFRLHLRIEKNGMGILIVNAATVLHLNQTATEYAYLLVQGKSEDEAAEFIASRYRISFRQALQDYADFLERIDTLVTIPDLDPVTYLEFDRKPPYSDLSAPLRLDCALTYQLPANTDPNLAPIKRVKRELSTDEWKSILDKAWGIGIPHIIFTGGEPTLRDDLVELISHAESLGQVTGILTDGVKLADKQYLDQLLLTGLDHFLIIFQDIPQCWRAIQNAAGEDISTIVHLTLSPDNRSSYPGLLAHLASSGIRSISLSAADRSLTADLIKAREQAAHSGFTLVWDIPVPYSKTNPFSLELEEHEIPSGAATAWLYIEPDGDVLPDQSSDQVLGNILTDPWEMILHKSS